MAKAPAGGLQRYSRCQDCQAKTEICGVGWPVLLEPDFRLNPAEEADFALLTSALRGSY